MAAAGEERTHPATFFFPPVLRRKYSYQQNPKPTRLLVTFGRVYGDTHHILYQHQPGAQPTWRLLVWTCSRTSRRIPTETQLKSIKNNHDMYSSINSYIYIKRKNNKPRNKQPAPSPARLHTMMRSHQPPNSPTQRRKYRTTRTTMTHTLGAGFPRRFFP